MIYLSPEEIRGSRLEVDLCVIGSGAAGLSLASVFLGSRWKLLVLESGAAAPNDWASELNLIDQVGVQFRGATAGRVRAFGGTTRAWGGQLIPLRGSELTSRPWVPHSGWPISDSVLAPYYRKAESLLGVDGPPYDESVWEALRIQPPAFDPSTFCYRFSQWAPLGRRNFGLLFGPALRRSSNVDVALNATVTKISTDPSGDRVVGVQTTSQSGPSLVVRARYYVLACGALETARLLLASGEGNSQGVANSSGLVGRFFQDHISCIAGEVRPSSRAVVQKFFEPRYRGRTMYSCKVELTDQAQQNMQTLNVMGHIKFAIPEALGLLEVRRMLHQMQAGKLPVPSLREAAALARGAGELSRLVAIRLFQKRRASASRGAIDLVVDAEQAPNPDSRVRLSDRRDALGLRKVLLDWRIGTCEMNSIRTFAQLFARAFQNAGLGQIDVAAEPDFSVEGRLSAARDMYHHLGTTRMSASLGTGVVTPTLRCHDVVNLYIVGGSVFPAGGIANPTFTIIALALRLADELKSRLAAQT